METVECWVLKRHDGIPVNWKFEPVKSLRSAARFYETELFEQLMSGHHKPNNPDDYYISPIKITYEEVQHERDKEPIPKN